MTVSTTTSRVEYAGNGSTTAFSVPFYFLASGDLKVYKAGVLQTLTTHYTVSGAGNPAGGTVTFLSAPATGQTVVVFRDPALTQNTDYVPNDPFPAESHERALDRLTMIAQRNRDLVDRAFVLPDGVTGVNTDLPVPEANTVIAWDSSGTALQNRDAADFATALTYADRRVETFTGNGSAVDFVLAETPAVIANTDVDIEGVSQVPGVDYQLLADGVTLRFDAAPGNGLTICVKYGQAVAQSRDDAATVYFSQSGAGAVSRSVQEKLRETVSVKDFGAVGDGATNDTDAFAAASAYITSLGGGTLIIPPGTYIVGKQVFAGANGKGYSYKGQKVLDFYQCSKPVRIIGSGAVLKIQSGLKFGSFDPVTGNVYNPSMPFTNANYVASPVEIGVITIRQCTANFEIVGLEIDGNSANLTLGGTWGDTGRQIACYGIYSSVSNNVSVRNCYVHHMALDGLAIVDGTITAEDSPSKPHVFENVMSTYNARQGLSIVGGKGITCIRCQFSHTGRGAFSSAPSAGVDIEPGSGLVYDVTFIDCEFVNNVGVGLINDQSDKAYNIKLQGCLLWGTTSWSLWMRGNYFVAVDCRIYGSIVNMNANDADLYPSKAAKFKGCLFSDEQYGGNVYGGNFNLGAAYGVSFEDCDFMTKYSRLGTALSGPGATRFNSIKFSDCRFLFMWDGNPDKGYALNLQGVTLSNCLFSESYATPPANGYYIVLNGAVYVLSGVYMDTTYTRWNSWSSASGWTGPIPQNQGQTNTYQLLLQRSGGITPLKLQRDTAIPTSGDYLRGDIVLYTSPSAGGYIGAVCTTAGSPGTWKEFGAILA
jgi:hypothetical protein